MVFGTGTGLLLAQVPNLTLSSLRADETDEGSGVQNSAKETGSALGTAIIGSVMMVAAMTSLVAGVTRAEGSELFGDALEREVVAAFVALALIGATFLPRGKRSPSEVPDAETDDEGEPLLPGRGATPQRGC